MTFEFVEKEEAQGQIAGSLYGASVRIMARSPTHVLFNALGLQCWNRCERGGFRDTETYFRDRPNTAKYEAVQARVDATFGEGVGAAVIEAWRKHKTVLVDGGGKALPLPNHTRAKISRARYAEITVDERVDLTGEAPCCLQCGKQLRLDTDHHRLGFEIKPDHPRSLADCQRMTNARVVACHGYGPQHPKHFGLVSWFEVWDGVSMIDEDFCGNTCAALFGRRAAKLVTLEPGVKPEAKPHRIRDDTQHYTLEPRTIAGIKVQ